MCVFNYAKPGLFNLLNRAVWEDAFFLAIRKETLDGAIWETDLFCSIREVLFDLVILELKNLQAVWESSLRRLSIREEVHNFPSWECLLDILILEENNLVAIWPNFPLNAIGKDYFFFAAFVELLLFAFRACDFVQLDQILVGVIRVVLLREDQVIVFFLHFIF